MAAKIVSSPAKIIPNLVHIFEHQGKYSLIIIRLLISIVFLNLIELTEIHTFFLRSMHLKLIEVEFWFLFHVYLALIVVFFGERNLCIHDLASSNYRFGCIV